MKKLILTLMLLFLLPTLAWSTSYTLIANDIDALSGRLQNTSTVYATARDSTDASAVNPALTGIVGQRYSSSTYATYRSLYRFDTSAITASATVDSVLVKVVVVTVGSSGNENDFYSKLVAADDTMSTTTFHTGQYNDFEGWVAGSAYSVTVLSDSLLSSGYAVGDTMVFRLNAAGIAEMNKTGTTQFFLMDGFDIWNISPKRGVEPSYYEDLTFEDDSPYLYIYYRITATGGITYNIDSLLGNDANSGLPGSPWKTLSPANANSAKNDTYSLKRGGTYGANANDTCAVIAADSTTYNAYGDGAMPVIDASKRISTWQKSYTVPDSSGNARHGVAYGTDTLTVATLTGTNFTGTEYIDLTADWIGTGDVTVSGDMVIRGAGGGNAGRIYSNGKFILYVAPDSSIVLMRDGSASASTNNGVVPFNTKINLVVTSTSTGGTHFFIDGAELAYKDSTAGNGTAGSTNVLLGNASTLDKGLNGVLANMAIRNWKATVAQADSIYKGTIADNAVGPELVTNGAFADSSGWTWGGGWYATKTAGKAEGVSVATTYINQY
jgi:hypothetical protein